MSDWAPLPGPTLQPAAEPLADPEFHLWRDAPAWRNLVLSGVGFSVALLVLPFIDAPSHQPAQNVTACQGNSAPSGQSGHGQVVGFLTTDEAMRLMQQTQFAKRMAISPDYMANVRSLVHIDGSVEGWRTVFIVPQGMNVRIGDRVEVVGSRLDPDLPCHYIPNLITRDLAQ